METVDSLMGVISFGIATVGSLLLSDNKLEAKPKLGAWLMFFGFVTYALWNSYLLGTLTAAAVFLVFLIGALLWRFRKQKFKKR
jgi:hypothetical protein